MKQADIALENNTLHLSGELDFFNVMSVYDKSLSLVTGEHAIVDFSRLIDANSAGIALMIAWKKHWQNVEFRHVSAELKSIASVAGLNELLALS